MPLTSNRICLLLFKTLRLPSNQNLQYLSPSARISADDLSRLFDIVELCSVNPDTLVEGNNAASPTSPAAPSTWTISEHEGRWAPGSSAGGSRRYRSALVTVNGGFKLLLHQIETNDLTMTSLLFHFSTQESFWKNPQFELSLTEQDKSDDEDEDEDDEDDGGDDEDGVDSGAGADAPSKEEKKRAEKKEKRSKQCTVLVELLQKNRRQKGKVHFLYIAFHVYKVALPLLHLSASAITTNSHDCFFCLLSLQISPEVTIPDKIDFQLKSFHPFNKICIRFGHFCITGLRVFPQLQGVCLTRNFFMKTGPVGRSGKYKAQR